MTQLALLKQPHNRRPGTNHKPDRLPVSGMWRGYRVDWEGGGGVIINTLWWILAQQTTQDFTNHLLSPLPTRWVCTHTTVCRPASILNMEQSAESVETAEDLTTSPSASRLSTRCQPLAVSTQSAPSRYGNYMYNCNHSIFKFVFDQTFTTYKKL